MSKETESAIAIPKIEYYTKTVHHSSYDRISPTRPELSARGKNVVVTGGGTGIGEAIAKSFAEAGAKSVSILGRRQDRLKTAASKIEEARSESSSRILYRAADLVDREAVINTFQSIAAEVGAIDILVSNAAVLPNVTGVVNYKADDLMHGFELNVITALNALQAFVQVKSARPIVINISSSLAHLKPIPGTVGYSVSKAANLKLMDYFAAEHPDIHVINLQPGTCETEMSAKVGVKAPDTVDLPGHFAVWLASPEAEFLKSKFVWANWDVDELLAEKEEIQESNLFTVRLDGTPM